MGIGESCQSRRPSYPHFVQWWQHFPAAWRTAIVDHLRVEWQRRFAVTTQTILASGQTDPRTSRVRIYAAPTRIRRPLLEQIIPNAPVVIRMLRAQPNPKALRAEWIATLAQRNQKPESYVLPIMA